MVVEPGGCCAAGHRVIALRLGKLRTERVTGEWTRRGWE